MGYSTIGSILVGPKKFPELLMQKACEHLDKLRAACLSMQERLKSGDEDFEAVIEDPEFSPDKSGDLHVVLARFADSGHGVWDDAMDDLIAALSPSPGAFLDEFVEAWNCQFRDTMVRDMPGNKEQQIIVAAQRTWGDGLESGLAAELFWRADMLGIYPLLWIT